MRTSRDEVHAEGSYFIEWWEEGRRVKEAAGPEGMRPSAAGLYTWHSLIFNSEATSDTVSAVALAGANPRDPYEPPERAAGKTATEYHGMHTMRAIPSIPVKPLLQ
jgi:hypothetical protein